MNNQNPAQVKSISVQVQTAKMTIFGKPFILFFVSTERYFHKFNIGIELLLSYRNLAINQRETTF